MIYEELLTGEENAKTAKELCKKFNINARELAQIVREERRQGHPIASSNGKTPGYFLAANKTEMENFCASLFRRAGEIHRTRKYCLATLDKLPKREADSDGNETQAEC